MTDRPIIFSAPMVRALLEDRKTQTRRLATSPLRRCEPGDRLYVRESYSPMPWTDAKHPNRWNLAYAATGGGDYVVDAPSDFNPMLYNYERWTPSIHMPRWASRLTLIVEDVRVEPLQEISEADALAEGIERQRYPERGDWGWPQQRYAELWDSLHHTCGEGWIDNPDVLVLTFRIEHGNIDRITVPRNVEAA